MEHRRAEAQIPHQFIASFVQSLPEVSKDKPPVEHKTHVNFNCSRKRGFTFYKMSNLDNRISNADQLLTNDIDKFCESVTDFYSNASKPVLDIIIYMYRLTANIGAKVF